MTGFQNKLLETKRMTDISKFTVAQVKSLLSQISSPDDDRLLILAKDPRKGVQMALKAKEKAFIREKAKIEAHQAKLVYENDLWQNQSFKYIAGIDEVGRGPLAGPVVTAAVILPQDCAAFIGINDSKQLSHQQRVSYAEIIKENALAYSIAIGSAQLIDQVNIYQATRQMMVKAVANLAIQPDYLLLDAMQIESSIPQRSIIKGDQKSLSIAAASIIAKVYRDQIMDQYALEFPYYDFQHNKGYGTQNHLAGLNEFGYSPIHRRSFEPVKSMVKKLNNT